MANGPINRKKHVTGKASEDSVQVHGEGRGDGPVGAADGYADRKEQQSGAKPGTASKITQQVRPGQSTPQRPSGTQQSNPFAARPQNTQSTQRPSGTQQSNPFAARPQNTQSTQRPSGTQSNPFAARPQQNTQNTQRPSGTQSNPFAARPQQNTQSTQRPQSTQQRPQQFQQTSGTSGGSSGRRSGGGSGKLILIIIAVVVLLGGGGGLSGLFGGGGSSTSGSSGSSGAGQIVSSLLGGDSGSSALGGLLGGDSGGSGLGGLLSGGLSSLLSGGLTGGSSASSASSGLDLSSVLGGSWFSSQTGLGGSQPQTTGYSPVYSTTPSGGANYTALNRSVAPGSRAKYTVLKGNGRDTATILVYMCGADLESKSAMATKDLQEMLNASFGSNVNLVIFTGGSTGWRNNMVSSQVNQVWQIKNGQMNCLVENAGTGAMTSPDTLASFIQYGKQNFKASRYGLILWDHGSGSVAGYGYDERNPRAGSMSLAGLNSAFQSGGIKFDFIGFDTCLLASVENALMASHYADYLIASEETEPGIGWYYTNWLTALGQNTSIATLDLGKQICDDFVAQCAQQCRGQQTTLSVIDLAELSNTVPAKLSAFADGITDLVSAQQYKIVSNARNGSREFATSARIDQVDLADLCYNLNTQESADLAQVLREAVKYNRTNIADAYGLSVYFPYQRISNVDKAVSTYAAIGMDDSYSKAIRAFASVEASGQAVSGSSGSALSSLFGGGSSSSSGSGDLIGSLLSSFLGGGMDGMDFLSGRTLTEEQLGQYLTVNMLDPDKLVFQRYSDQWVIDLPAEQWALVHGIDMNMFYRTDAGYIDMGLDNLFELDPETGLMIADTSGTWLAINGQPVPYYHELSESVSENEWRITGRVPALLNGDRVDLLLVFDQDHESGYVAGARAVYDDPAIEAIPKNLTEIAEGDTITFLADLYDENQNHVDNYAFGNPITVAGELTVSDVEMPDPTKAVITYRFTDIYNVAYWTQAIGK